MSCGTLKISMRENEKDRMLGIAVQDILIHVVDTAVWPKYICSAA